MLNQLVEVAVQCPYCWEEITLLIDASIEMQDYVEDCEVCCRPILLSISVAPDGSADLVATVEND